jgi:hypothetical protein
VLAATFAVSHNVEEAKPLAAGNRATTNLEQEFSTRDWGIQQVPEADECATRCIVSMVLRPVARSHRCECSSRIPGTRRLLTCMTRLAPQCRGFCARGRDCAAAWPHFGARRVLTCLTGCVQVLTSANWGGVIGNFFTGGLNLQVEHHLFPAVSFMHCALRCHTLGLGSGCCHEASSPSGAVVLHAHTRSPSVDYQHGTGDRGLDADSPRAALPLPAANMLHS